MIEYDPKNSYRAEDKTGYKKYGETEKDWWITVYTGEGTDVRGNKKKHWIGTNYHNGSKTK